MVGAGLFSFSFLINFICFGCSGSLSLLGFFSSWGEGRLFFVVHRLLVAEPRLSDLSSRGSQARELWRTQAEAISLDGGASLVSCVGT